MKFLLDKKQALWVEEAYEEDFVYIWLKGPCLDLRSRRQIINPSSVFYACYQGLDILKKYSKMTDARTSQKMNYLPREIYEEMSPKYDDSDVMNFCRDEFFVIITLCELLHLTGEGTPQEIAEIMYNWISSTIDRAHSDYKKKLSQLADEIDTEYNYKSPITIVAKGVERSDSIHHNGEETIISYVRNYLHSERRISDEIKELLRNEGNMSKVEGLAQSDAAQTAAVSDGVSKEDVERLEARVKELEGLLEAKEREMAEVREEKGGSMIRIANRKKSSLELLLCGLYYADYFVNDKGVRLGRDETVQEILKHGFQCESGRISKDISQYLSTGTVTAFKDDLIKDFKKALDDVERVQR